jgi:hypothetical protein
MRHLCKIGGLLMLLAVSGTASAQETIDMKGTWLPSTGDDLIDGDSKYTPDGTKPIEGGDGALHKDTTQFVFQFDGQDGKTFWGTHTAGKVVEKMVGAISGDGKRFVIADEDGTFNGIVIDSNTLDFCYAHATPTSRAAACGLLVRQK